jgi:hypothetical protein
LDLISTFLQALKANADETAKKTRKPFFINVQPSTAWANQVVKMYPNVLYSTGHCVQLFYGISKNLTKKWRYLGDIYSNLLLFMFCWYTIFLELQHFNQDICANDSGQLRMKKRTI